MRGSGCVQVGTDWIHPGRRALCRNSLRRRAPVDLMNGGLVRAFDEQLVNVYVRRPAGDPNERFGDIFGSEGFDAFVNFLCALGVALEADDRKFSLGQAGIDGADAHARAIKFEAQRLGDLQFSSFRPAVSRTAFIRHPPCDRSNVDDDAPGVVGHQWQARARHAQHPEDIGLHHELPIFVLRLRYLVQALCPTGIVNQHIQLVAVAARPLHERLDAAGLADIEKMCMRFFGAGFGALRNHFFQAIFPPRAQQQFRALGTECARRGRAEAARSACDQDPFTCKSRWHGLILYGPGLLSQTIVRLLPEWAQCE